MPKKDARRRCNCGRRFHPRSWNHRACPACSVAHRAGNRCESLVPCATCDKAFARLAAYNVKRKAGGVDRDRRRGVDVTCPCGCGMTYAGFRAGNDFGDARRDFIVIPEDKNGRRRHGDRKRVLGKLREWKLIAWDVATGQHVSAKGAA